MSEHPGRIALSLLFGGRQVGSLSEVRNGPALEVPRTEIGEVFGYKWLSLDPLRLTLISSWRFKSNSHSLRHKAPGKTVEDHKAQQLPRRAGCRLEPLIDLDETNRFLSVYNRATYFGQLYVHRVAQNSLHTKGNILIEVYWRSTYVYWVSETFQLSSFRFDITVVFSELLHILSLKDDGIILSSAFCVVNECQAAVATVCVFHLTALSIFLSILCHADHGGRAI